MALWEREQVKTVCVLRLFELLFLNLRIAEYDGPNLLCTCTMPCSSVTGDSCRSDCQEDLACCASGFAILLAPFCFCLVANNQTRSPV